MLKTLAIGAFLLAAAWLWRQGRRERDAMMHHRAHLLDEVASLFPSARFHLESDGFPVAVVPRADGSELVLGLVADTLVTRRLPQLWLKLTLREGQAVRDFSLAALARPAGSEFYAMTHDLPDWVAPPAGGEVALLLRSRKLPADPSLATIIAELFSDTQLKEAAVTPRGVRIIRQACQGDRGSHLLLRQARFDIQRLSADTILRAVHDAEHLSAVLRNRTVPLAEAA